MRHRGLQGLLIAWAICCIAGLAPAIADSPLAGKVAESRGGMVVSVSQPASEVGQEILKAGGNAVDAAIATAFALAATWPEAGNIGGGGFMVIYPGKGVAPVVIDYRETAPAKATPDMFATGTPSEYLRVGVPGTVRGLELAHQKFGSLPWRDLVYPAALIAKQGLPMSLALAKSLNKAISHRGATVEFKRVLSKDGRGMHWEAGDRLRQHELAHTLWLIGEYGANAFYSGRLADLLVLEMQHGGGLITKDDLQNYRAQVRSPIHGTFRGFDIYATPPPSSGGICLIEMLNVVEALRPQMDDRWSAPTAHLLIETMRRAYCDRARYLGDADFVKIPPHLVTKEYAAQLAKQISSSRATPSESLAPELLASPGGDNTTHFSVVDKNGMAVSNTYTLEQSFGSKIMVAGAGYVLNNEMGDFNPRPGVTNREGLIGTPANLAAPGKRMLSSMTPVIVARDGHAVLITGSPGGRTIINTVFCVLLNVLDDKMPLHHAVTAPRLHHAWFPDLVRAEDAFWKQNPQVMEGLEKLGHKVDRTPHRQGDAHSISIDPATGIATGVADERIDGWAAGN